MPLAPRDHGYVMDQKGVKREGMGASNGAEKDNAQQPQF